VDNGFYLALGVTVILPFVQWLVPSMPRVIAYAGIIGGISVMLTEFLGPEMRPPLSAALLFLVGVSCIGVALHLYMQHVPQKHASSEAAHPVASSPTEPTRPSPTFEATNRSEILAKGAGIAGTIPFPLARADNDSKIDMSGMLWISPDAPTTFPAPTGEFSKRSNADMRSEVGRVTQELQSFQATFNDEIGKLGNPGNSREAWESYTVKRNIIYSKFSQEYHSRFAGLAISLAAGLISRIKGLETNSISQNANIGAHVILERKFAGGQPCFQCRRVFGSSCYEARRVAAPG
jgi:hypothetical protein